MKLVCLFALFFYSFLAVSSERNKKDLRSAKSFISSCPVEFFMYVDRAEGGAGAYCACPEENISYLDYAEGGKGFFCSLEKIDQDVRTGKEFISTCPDKYLTYIDRTEGSLSPYCACPKEKVSYLDGSEGGIGFYCTPN